MQVATKLGSTPAMDRYLCVPYISGLVSRLCILDGDRRVKNWRSPPQMEFRFRGTLDLV